MKRKLVSVAVGGGIGYLYYYYIGCTSGACAITSNPFISTAYMAILTVLLVELLYDTKKPNDKELSVFDRIASIYALFYKKQKRTFLRVFADMQEVFDLSAFRTVLDVGCGTGALCSVFEQKGFDVTGIDPSEKMLNMAKKKTKNERIKFIQADVLETLPFEDKQFDLSISSYVAHGMHAEQRKKLYMEMSRVTKDKVIIYDYNQKRELFTTMIEWLEHGNYFNFIKNPEGEMKSCTYAMKKCFLDVQVIPAGPRSAWYICTPHSNGRDA